MSKKIRIMLIALIIFPSCVSVDEKKISQQNKSEIQFEKLRGKGSLPQWFFSPSPGKTIGSIGFSRRISIGEDPELHARRYALDGILEYNDIKPSPKNSHYMKLINGEIKEAIIEGKLFSVPDMFKTKDYFIARAVSGPYKQFFENTDKEVSPFDCRPFWLCSPGSGDTGGVIGVSYRAVSPQRQYELAVKNGLLLMKYAYGVDVAGTEEVRRLRSGTGVLRLRKNNMSFKILGNTEKIRIYVKGVRYVGETLYVWLVSPDLPGFEPDTEWIYGKIKKGAVGISGKTASGLLSGQIEKAVENAVLSMAKNKDVMIDVEDFTRKNTYFSIFDQYVKSTVKTKVFPSLRGFYLDREEKVHVWLVPN